MEDVRRITGKSAGRLNSEKLCSSPKSPDTFRCSMSRARICYFPPTHVNSFWPCKESIAEKLVKQSAKNYSPKKMFVVLGNMAALSSIHICLIEFFTLRFELWKVAVFFIFVIKSYNSFLLYLTNKEASTVLCSVVKDAGSGRTRKKCRGKHETQSSVFPLFLGALPFPRCFTTEQSTVEISLIVNY